MASTVLPDIRTYSLDYQEQETSTSIVIKYVDVEPLNAVSTYPRLLFFTGFGEQSREALHAAAGPFTDKGFRVTSIAVPFHTTSLKAAAWLLEEGLQSLVQKLTSSGTPYILSGTSRGATIAAALAKDSADCTGLVMILPLGIKNLSSGMYISRSLWDYISSFSFLDKEARKNTKAVTKEVLQHSKSADGLPAALKFAMSQAPLVAKGITTMHKKDKLLAIFAGKKDRIFPPSECKTAVSQILGKSDSDEIVMTVLGGHTTVASKTGQAQLAQIAEWLSNHY